MFADARAALKSPWLYLSSAVALVVLLRPTMERIISAWQGLSVMDVMTYYSHVDAFTGIGRFLVLFCTLPLRRLLLRRMPQRLRPVHPAAHHPQPVHRQQDAGGIPLRGGGPGPSPMG